VSLSRIPLTIAQLSDVHVGGPLSFPEEKMTQIVERVRSVEPDVVVVAGDLTTAGYEWEYEEVAAWLDTIEFPKVVIPGNHDARNVGYLHFRDLFGEPFSRHRETFDAERSERLQATGFTIVGLDSSEPDVNEGRIGLSVLNTAAGKIRPDVVTLFFKGILCNVLVCAGVWLAYAGRSVTDKFFAILLPVSAFIAAGFEHCVANMYFLPLAWLLVQTGHAPATFDASPITIAGIIHNLVPVTLGNIVGGAGFVGAIYWAIYRAAFGALGRGEPK